MPGCGLFVFAKKKRGEGGGSEGKKESRSPGFRPAASLSFIMKKKKKKKGGKEKGKREKERKKRGREGQRGAATGIIIIPCVDGREKKKGGEKKGEKEEKYR